MFRAYASLLLVIASAASAQSAQNRLIENFGALAGNLKKPAPAPQPLSLETGAPISASEWGLFAQLAERDFANSIYLVTFRWTVPNERLELVYWAGGGRQTTPIVRDPATGQLTWMNLGGLGLSPIAPLRVEADGSISRALKKDRYEPWITVSGPGEYQMDNRPLEPTVAGTPVGERLAKILAAGKLAPGKPVSIAQIAAAEEIQSADKAWRLTGNEGQVDSEGQVKQTPQGAHRFLQAIAEQGSFELYYHYRGWPAYMMAYKITGVAENGDCRTMFSGRPEAVQLAGGPIYRAGMPTMAEGMREFGARYPHRPLPWTIDWSKATSVTLTGSTAQSGNDEMTVLVSWGGTEIALHLPDQALAKRVRYALSFLKETCDRTAETGF